MVLAVIVKKKWCGFKVSLLKMKNPHIPADLQLVWNLINGRCFTYPCDNSRTVGDDGPGRHPDSNTLMASQDTLNARNASFLHHKKLPDEPRGSVNILDVRCLSNEYLILLNTFTTYKFCVTCRYGWYIVFVVVVVVVVVLVFVFAIVLVVLVVVVVVVGCWLLAVGWWLFVTCCLVAVAAEYH